MYCYVWSYAVRPERLDDFRSVYGPEGAWVRLFRRDPAYVRTLLFQDHHDEARFLTIDFWQSREAFQAFRRRLAPEFDALDQSCEDLTLEETSLGEFSTPHPFSSTP